MNKIVKDALILFLITAVAGLLLALVNEVTKEPIAIQNQKVVEEGCRNVFIDASSFTDNDILSNSEIANAFTAKYPKITVTNVYNALDASGNLLGYVITLSTKEGYGDNITFSMGITNERVLNGVSILSSNETVGLGLEAENVLVPQFAGKTALSFSYTKTGSTNDSEIDAISSATITTNAFVNAVNAGLDYYDNYLKLNN